MTEIAERDLTDFQEIYRDQTAKTIVSIAQYRHPSGTSCPVAVKTITSQGMIEPYVYIEECMNQLRIDSVHVCKLYGWSILPGKVMIVMERLDGDLAKEVVERRATNRYFTEEELFRLCWDLVCVFAQMEMMSIAHSDIKAENVFTQNIDGKVVYKVGDFGSASVVRRKENGVSGTPLYLSPILKREFMIMQQTRESREFRHNPYKSDVFSLGVTFLIAAELQTPTDLLDISLLDQKIATHISTVYQLGYQSFARYIRWMLTIDESQRCTFTELKASLQTEAVLQGYIQLEAAVADPEDPSLTHIGPDQTINLMDELNLNYRNGQLESVAMLLRMIKDDECGQLPLEPVLTSTYMCGTCATAVTAPATCRAVVCTTCTSPIAT